MDEVLRDRRLAPLLCERFPARPKSHAYGLVDARLGMMQMATQEGLPVELLEPKIGEAVRRMLRRTDVVMPSYGGRWPVLLEGYFHHLRLRSIADRLESLEIEHRSRTFWICVTTALRNVAAANLDRVQAQLEEDLIQRSIDHVNRIRPHLYHRT